VALRGLIRRPRAILLDALGTLVGLEPPAPRLRLELAQRFGLEVSEAQAERAIQAEIVYYRAHLDQGRDEARLIELRARCAQVLAAELQRILDRDVPAGPEMVDALLASLRFTAFADARPALTALRSLGLRLVVVSNWDASLGEVLGRVGLSDQLDGVVTSAAVGVGKPHPAVFQRALELVGMDPADAVHVGDNLREDVDGARAAGIEAVLIIRGEASDRPHRPKVPTVRTLRELPSLLCLTDG
jgi:putative hydrolase of the HAD superfamily